MESPFGAEVIRDVLSAHPLHVTVFPQRSSCGTWSLSTSRSRKCAFHLVTRGECRLQLKDGRHERLGAGDVAMFPREAWHEVAGSVSDARLVCGSFDFYDPRGNPILEALPDVVILRARDEDDARRMSDFGGLLEMEAGAANGEFVRDKLGEVLFAMAVRAHLESPEDKHGLLAALADPRLGRALAAIHREPHRPWNLKALAGLAGMSRTALIQAFSKLLGTAPMQYVAAWRMRSAAVLLKDSRNSVANVAARLGYRSEAAFRRAFKRLEGSGPGALRRA
jgi:AraC family transcriptional regulator, activator of mtrCDE